MIDPWTTNGLESELEYTGLRREVFDALQSCHVFVDARLYTQSTDLGHAQMRATDEDFDASTTDPSAEAEQEALRELIHAEMLNFHPNSGSEDPK